MVFTFISWALALIFCFGLGKPLTALFIDGSTIGDPALYNSIVGYSFKFLIYQCLFYPFLGIVYVYRNTLQGIGKSAVTTIAGVTELAGRSVTAFILVKYIGYTGVCLSNPIAWMAADIFLLTVYAITMNKYGGVSQYSLKSLLTRRGTPAGQN